MPALINQRPVIVTGGAHGIGAALAAEASARGASAVVVADVDLGAAQATASAIPNGHAAECDVADAVAVQELAESVVAEQGVPGLVCANAGVMASTAPMLDIDPNDAAWILSVNALGVFHTLQSFGRLMRDDRTGGWLMATGSEHSTGVPHPFASPYTASKHAVLGMCDVLRTELPDHVGVSVLCPGLTASQLWNAGAQRPERFGGAVEGDPAAGGFMESAGMSAATVAQRALDGVEAGRFLIPTHYNARRYAEARAADMAEAFDHLKTIDTTDYDVSTLAADLLAQPDRGDNS